jgi:hypothetical protein
VDVDFSLLGQEVGDVVVVAVANMAVAAAAVIVAAVAVNMLPVRAN